MDKYAELGERLERLGLERLAVAARTDADNPIGADTADRANAVAATKANLDSAAALGAPLLCGPLGAPLGVFSGAGPTGEEVAHAVEYLREVAAHAEERGVTIAVEYLNRFEMYLTNTAADLAALVREVDHPRVRMLYDTFHAHIEEKDPREALGACADVLVHFHASENDRGTPGTGQVDWDATFDGLRQIGYESWIVIEAFGDALPDLAAATKIWRRTFANEEQLARDGLAFLQQAMSLTRLFDRDALWRTPAPKGFSAGLLNICKPARPSGQKTKSPGAIFSSPCWFRMRGRPLRTENISSAPKRIVSGAGASFAASDRRAPRLGSSPASGSSLRFSWPR